MYIQFLTVLVIVSLSLTATSYAESTISCPNCVQIKSYEIDLYKEMFPLTIWTDSQVYNHHSIIKVNGYLKPQNTIAPILVVVTNPVGNVVTIQQLASDNDGNFSFELNTESSLWKQNGDYILKAQSGTDTRQFKTKFTLVSSIIGDVDKCKFNEISTLANNDRIYCIPFKITNGVVTSTKGTLNSDTKTIIFNIGGHDIESVTFYIPRYILDSKSSTYDDSIFTVLANGNMIEYLELGSNSSSRQITLNHPITGKTTFEIIGTNIIPEFGSISILILFGSIMSILIISKSFSNRFIKL